ncbi:preprotein translocase subunit SecE [Mycoplasmopsis columbina]|uniref:Preprotein translocase subunit SecE n=1 Tax=Mycoplasmopsis columbina SF7 TaxID=1037410 RepID=F9UJD4_9BACT|nr:preprotein translocase subunit SecE [Mycoplasmopsis columbina]EGV00477.1 hypothetical protein MCSF7_02963 [Mycoplasmopsis columbina SF7]VEU76615.1 preprotein translocase subunit SecE [Mycoplasmopsis columbina]
MFKKSKDSKVKIEKVKKPKKYFFRRFFKEIKRVRWPSSKTNWSSFFQVVIFSSIFIGIVIIFATIFALIWKSAGI